MTIMSVSFIQAEGALPVAATRPAAVGGIWLGPDADPNVAFAGSVALTAGPKADAEATAAAVA